MGRRMIVFDVHTILRLLTHYTEGLVPIDCEVKAAGPSLYLASWFKMDTLSKEWDADDWKHPLHIRYEGQRNVTFERGKGAPPAVEYAGDRAPKRTD